MIDHELGDDADATGMGRTHELPEIGKRAIVRMNVAIGANVITVIQARRRIEWQKPDGVDAEIADVVELGYQSRERSEEHTSELQSQSNLVCRLLLEKKKTNVTSGVPSHASKHSQY